MRIGFGVRSFIERRVFENQFISSGICRSRHFHDVFAGLAKTCSIACGASSPEMGVKKNVSLQFPCIREVLICKARGEKKKSAETRTIVFRFCMSCTSFLGRAVRDLSFLWAFSSLSFLAQESFFLLLVAMQFFKDFYYKHLIKKHFSCSFRRRQEGDRRLTWSPSVVDIRELILSFRSVVNFFL